MAAVVLAKSLFVFLVMLGLLAPVALRLLQYVRDEAHRTAIRSRLHHGCIPGSIRQQVGPAAGVRQRAD